MIYQKPNDANDAAITVSKSIRVNQLRSKTNGKTPRKW